MATRSLGTLTLDLVARIGGFTRGMTEAEREADKKSREIARKQKQRAREVEKAWQGAVKVIGTAFAGVSIAGMFSSFVRESIDAQNEQAQLAAVIKSTGAAAGFTVDQLNQMAAAMAGKSTFGEGDINRAQTRLLSYTGIVGEQFPAAMQAVIDMAARMGMSIEQSAETIGRALDIPSQGLTALQRQGFRFSEEQKKAVEQLEQTGRVAEAQAIVLQALESSYGGAAQAARDTFGGAIAALQEELRTLMTGGGGSLEGARQAIENLTETMRSPATKQGFDQLINGLATVMSYVVSAISEFATFGDVIAREMARATTGLVPLDKLKGDLNDLDRALNNSFLFKPIKYLTANREELERMRTAVVAQIEALEGAGRRPSAASPSTAAPSAAEQARLAAARAAATAAGRSRSTSDPLASLLAGTDIGRLKEFDKQVALLNQRYESGRVGVELYNQAMTKLVETTFAANFAEHNKQMAEQAETQRAVDEHLQATTEALYEQNRAWVEAGRALEDEMRTPLERANIEFARLQELLDRGAITWETYSRAVLKTQESIEDLPKQLEQMDSFAKKAAENIQDAFADFLFDPFDKGLKGMLQGFGQMIQRMIADAVAADLARHLFGDLTKGGTGSGLFGDLLSGIGKMFNFANGGIMTGAGPLALNAYAGGGIANSPQLALFGEGSRPEAFVPLPDGRRIPVALQNGAADLNARATNITINISGNQSAPEVRRAAAQGAREGMAAFERAGRYV